MYFSIPTDTKTDIQIFKRPVSADNTEWHVWERPPKTSMVSIMCIGGGGGGGGGFTGASTTARGGGGGGGSSGQTFVIVPSYFIPDRLYIQVGAGGQGVGSGGGTAGSGILSYVAIQRNTTASNVIAISGAAAATGGGTGTAAAAGALGAASTIAVIGSMPLAGLGHFTAIAGNAGIAGGVQTGASGGSLTIPTTSVITTGGGGGGGTTSADFSGSNQSTVANTWINENKLGTATASAPNGNGGINFWHPLWSFGATGGAALNAAVGGAGGNGGFGSGGGGGGGGTTGGRGGDGGNGIVIIVSW